MGHVLGLQWRQVRPGMGAERSVLGIVSTFLRGKDDSSWRLVLYYLRLVLSHTSPL
jgi:hypothetical protein